MTFVGLCRNELGRDGFRIQAERQAGFRKEGRLLRVAGHRALAAALGSLVGCSHSGRMTFLIHWWGTACDLWRKGWCGWVGVTVMGTVSGG